MTAQERYLQSHFQPDGDAQDLCHLAPGEPDPLRLRQRRPGRGTEQRRPFRCHTMQRNIIRPGFVDREVSWFEGMQGADLSSAPNSSSEPVIQILH